MPLLVLALLVLAAGSGTPARAQSPDSARGVVVDDGGVAARRAADVAIAVGDRIAVKIWREPGLSDTSIVVDERGDVVLARIGTLRVAGQPIAAVQDTLRRRYAEYLRNPSIGVTVFRRIGVQGEVKTPGLYYADVTMTLREVLALAGGVTEIGNPRDIVIVRGGEPIAAGQRRAGGPLPADLRSGDQIVVGRRSWLSRNALAAVSTAGLVVSVLLTAVRSR